MAMVGKPYVFKFRFYSDVSSAAFREYERFINLCILRGYSYSVSVEWKSSVLREVTVTVMDFDD